MKYFRQNLYRLTIIMLVLTLLFGSCLPYLGRAYAAEKSVRFVAPCDIATDREHLYVLDSVNDNRNGVIHRFDFEGGDRLSITLDRAYKKLFVLDGTVYLLTSNYLVWGNMSDEGFNQIAFYSGEASTERLSGRDLTVFEQDGERYIIASGEGNLLITIKQSDGSYVRNDRLSSAALSIEFNEHSNKVYVLCSDEIIEYKLMGYNLDYLNVTTNTDGYTDLMSLRFAIDSDVCAYKDAEEIRNITKSVNLPFDTTDSIATAARGISQTLCGIFVMTKENKLVRYTFDSSNNTFSADTDWSLGTNEVNLPIPTQFSGCVAARSNGYPTNILYEATQAASSVDYAVLSQSDTFVICYFDGWEQSEYYLVYYLGKFGFIEKGADSIVQDKLTIAQTEISLKGKTNMTVFVYSFPYMKEGIQHADSLTVNTEVTISATINIWDGQFYLISYGDDNTKSGWINTSTIGNITLGEDQVVMGTYKVNPKLGQTLGLYDDEQLTKIKQESEIDIRLSVGAMATVISEKDGVSFVQTEIDGVDGKHYVVGYVESRFLIKSGLTDYQAFGLSLFIVALALTVFLIIIIKRRGNRLKRDKAEQLEKALNGEMQEQDEN